MNSSHRYVKHCTRLCLFVGYHLAQFIPKTNFHSNAMFFKMRWPTELQGFSHKLAAVLEGAKNKPYINTKHLHRSTFCFHKTCFRNRCLTNTLLTEMLNIGLPNFGYGVILGYPKVSKFERFDVSHFNICCSVAQSCPTLCDPMDGSTPGLPVHHQLPFIQTHVHWVGDAIQPSHPLSSPCLLPFPASGPSFSESAICIRWPKDWSFSFSISPSDEYSGLVSFRMDWFDLFAVQGTLKSLLQHPNAKALIIQHSVFFMVQLLDLYTTNHSFDYIDICGQKWCLCFWIHCPGLSQLFLQHWPTSISISCPVLWSWVCLYSSPLFFFFFFIPILSSNCS